jgi:hypothetical protein
MNERPFIRRALKYLKSGTPGYIKLTEYSSEKHYKYFSFLYEAGIFDIFACFPESKEDIKIIRIYGADDLNPDILEHPPETIAAGNLVAELKTQEFINLLIRGKKK